MNGPTQEHIKKFGNLTFSITGNAGMKLTERAADHELSKYLSNFDKIVDCQNGKKTQPYGQEDLGGFLAFERHTRLRNIPLFLSELIAYKVFGFVSLDSHI